MACSEPVKLGVAIARLAHSTSLSLFTEMLITRPRACRISPPRPTWRARLPAAAGVRPGLGKGVRGGNRPFPPRERAEGERSSEVGEHLLAEELQLPETVVAPELEHHVRAAGLAILLDRCDAFLGRPGD